MSKAEILDAIRGERNVLEALLQGLSPEQMTQPVAENDWSVKDILAHIVDWEQRKTGLLESQLGALEEPEGALVVDPVPLRCGISLSLYTRTRNSPELGESFLYYWTQ